MNGTMAALGRKQEAALCDERGQLCASAGDATYARVIGCVMISFQLTHPRWTRHVFGGVDVNKHMFQLTRPRGMRPSPATQVLHSWEFQLTRPRETQCPSCVRRNARRRFNSRVRKGRDCAAQRRVYNSAFPIFCAACSFARSRVFGSRAFTRTSSANPSRAPGVRLLRRTCASSVPRPRRRGRGARLL